MDSWSARNSGCLAGLFRLERTFCLHAARRDRKHQLLYPESRGGHRCTESSGQRACPLGLQIERHHREGYGELLIARSAAAHRTKPAMLLGHADTVYPPGTQPVHFIREGDYAKGPGVMDMKGGLVTMVWALQALSAAQKLSRIPVVLLSNCDEETGSTAFRERIEAEARAACAVLVFEPGRPQDGIVTQRKGVASWKVIATGKASHAGNAHQAGQNAITALARVITAVEALTNYEKGLTFNVGLISGGTAVNTVPEQAVAHFDVRCIDTEDYVAVRRHILS